MKSSYSALGLLCLTAAGLWLVGGGRASSTQSAQAAESPRLSAPVTHGNLSVYFIHGPDTAPDIKLVTLQEALEAGWAIITETGDVNNLTVENKSPEYELFIQEGDIIRGGRQDRLIARDMLLPPNSGATPFPCHCVEQGRWTGRGNEAATQFNKSDQFAVGAGLKYANALGQQGEVWQNVSVDQLKLSKATQAKVTENESSSSLQLALEHPAVKARVADYEEALRSLGESKADAIGVVFLVNGQVTGADLYGSNALFRKVWPKLLRAAATEALAGQTDGAAAYVPSVHELERFLTYGGRPRATANEIASMEELSEVRCVIDAIVTQDNLGQSNSPNVEVPLLRRPGLPSLREGLRESEAVGVRSAALNNGPASILEVERNDPQNTTRYVRDTGLNPTAAAHFYQGVLSNANDPQGEVRRRPQQNAAPAANNNLNISRLENAAGLLSESRDPTRQNTLIHKSLINPNAR